ncbi:CHAT domain-containing protein [Tistrella mobilis]|uniref:CHAT domain-containing protein n=1 Tax=Tistrella mobilis TaxID=171437 RepID=UPI0012E89708|nr:CHAT domain-containing protein [Tistrella mobilis]
MAATDVQLIVTTKYVRLKIGDRFDEIRPFRNVDSHFFDEIKTKYLNFFMWHDDGDLLKIGRKLYTWLDGEHGWCRKFREICPLVFEIQGPSLPDSTVWSVLSAPWELLADKDGFLAADELQGYSPLRRLGQPQPSPPVDDHRLAVCFMAAAPRGSVELDFEAEERAILASALTGIDLEVEDSGCALHLGERLATASPPLPVVHICCHGHHAWQFQDGRTEPALFLEDSKGDMAPTTAAALMRALRPNWPRLLFLSACETTRAGDTGSPLAPSLAAALVRAGVPAVLGWNGAVADRAAIVFAQRFYQCLSRRIAPAEAASEARNFLLHCHIAGDGDGAAHRVAGVLDPVSEGLAFSWHMAQLWVGAEGGAPVVGGGRRRRLHGPDHRHKCLLTKLDVTSAIAAPGMFVGRRRELQVCLRALSGPDHSGVLIHGMARIGKSSLAARIASRLPELTPVVVSRHYDVGSVLDALTEALADCRPARQLLSERRSAVLDEAERGGADLLHDVLVDLLVGPCDQRGHGRPLLMVIDGIERILAADPAGGRHLVLPDHQPVMAALLRAFRPDRGDSRLILTSLVPFSLSGWREDLTERLKPIALGGLEPSGRQKLALRQIENARTGGLDEKSLLKRLGLLERVVIVAEGHPGLQELIGRNVVLSPVVEIDRAVDFVQEMEAYVTGSGDPTGEEARKHVEMLAIDQLLSLVKESERALLRSMLLFDVPIPETVLNVIANEIGGSPRQLIDIGLLQTFEDVVRSDLVAAVVNPLVRPKLVKLSEEEIIYLSMLVIVPLFDVWGEYARRRELPQFISLLLTRIGRYAGNADVVAICAADAVQALGHSGYRNAMTFGQDIIKFLEENDVCPSLNLLCETIRASWRCGCIDQVDHIFNKIEIMTNNYENNLGNISILDVFSAYYFHAEILMSRKNMDKAELIFNKLSDICGRSGDCGLYERAMIFGGLADITLFRGRLDEALDIRQNKQIPLLVELGNVRAYAIALGKICDIFVKQGRLDAALRIRRFRQLPILKEIRDKRSHAISLGKIADILVRQGNKQEAMRIRETEQMPLLNELDEVRAKAIALGKVCDLLSDLGKVQDAFILRRDHQIPILERLRDIRSLAICYGKMSTYLLTMEKPREALDIRCRKQIPLLREIDDAKLLSVAYGEISNIIVYDVHKYHEINTKKRRILGALKVLRNKQLPLLRKLGAALPEHHALEKIRRLEDLLESMRS